MSIIASLDRFENQIEAAIAKCTISNNAPLTGLPIRCAAVHGEPDPNFEAQAKDILGLYLHAPENTAVFCVDEKTAIQALDRTQPALPLRPTRPERHTVECVRHGTGNYYRAATNYVTLGDKDAAFVTLEKEYARRG